MSGFGSNLDLFLKLKNSDGGLKDWKKLCETIISVTGAISDEDRGRIQEFCRTFTVNVAKRWLKSNRTLKTFLQRYESWLESDILWPTCSSVDLNVVMGYAQESQLLSQLKSSVLTDAHPQELLEVPPTSDASTSTTRTRKPFEDLTNRQKKRRFDSIVEDHSEEELLFFYVSKLKDLKKPELAKIVEHLGQNRQAVEDVTNLLFGKGQRATISDDKILAVNTALDFSKWKYLELRCFLREENGPDFPSYQKLLIAKKRCYPTDIESSETGASIKLQALLDHTVRRILLNLGPVTSLNHPGLKMSWKWGLDGSSSQSNYKQKSLVPELNDSSVVMTSIVPLRLVDETGIVVWENPAPGSTRYCRTIRFTFTSETLDFVKRETLQMEQEIAELGPTSYGDGEVVHDLHMTMIDGKVLNIVADVPSSATCPICLATPREMNNLELLATKPIREDIYKFGISSLHIKIRCMECLLHISYNMDFERWRVQSQYKDQQRAKKYFTQQEFRDQTGLLIDVVKQGFGTTNDGNTARRFFSDYQTSSRITGIDERLIFRFAVILQALSSGLKINIDNFRRYCKETSEMYVALYPWYYMPASVHKLLTHGADICQHFSNLPIGIMSEEASEARNKDFRNVRIWHTRKMGRKEANLDLLHYLLVSSDPYISRIRPKYFNLAHKELLPEAVELLHIDVADFEDEVMTMEAENVSDPLEMAYTTY